MADTPRPEGIRFHAARFSAPPALTDTSVLSFVDNPSAPAVSLTVAQEALAGGQPAFKVYVDEQQRAAQKAVPGYATTHTAERTVSGAPGFFVEGVVPSAGRGRRVLQLYVLDETRGRVFVVTATAADADAARARSALQHIEESFVLEVAP